MPQKKKNVRKGKQVDKAVLGYDPDKWIKSNVQIRSEDRASTEYTHLNLPPPIRGKHRFMQYQKMYEEVHAFMGQRRWAYAHPESSASGVTWAELFILYDTARYRTEEGQHIKDRLAAVRAEQRKAKDKRARSGKNMNFSQNSAVAKATYEQEVTLFKVIPGC